MPDLPITALSVSGMRTLRMCPTKWKRQYIDREYAPSSGAMTIGKAVGAAEAQSDHTWIESGEPLDTGQVLDSYSDEFDQAATEDVDWGDDQPATLKDTGAKALKDYHETVIPAMSKPVDAERESRIHVEHEDGDQVEFVAYLDVETEDGIVIDRKVKKAKLSQRDADGDKQVDAYLTTRRAEGNPAAGFAFHPMVKTKNPYAQGPVETERTEGQLDRFLSEILGAADEIAWRVETDNWSYAPDGAWWCSESMCGYFDTCPAGGLYRKAAVAAGKAG